MVNIDNISEEVWKDVPGYEGLYQVSSLGRVKSFWKNIPTILRPVPNSKGYPQAHLSKKGQKSKKVLLNRLVAMVFIPNPENLPQVNHLDTNPSNNRVSNLEWVTTQGNQLHANKEGHGYNRSGSRCHKAVVSESTVIEMVKLKGTMTSNAIAKMFGINRHIVHRIFSGETWSHLTGFKKRYKQYPKHY